MKDLLAQLSVETLVFDVSAPLEHPLQLTGVTEVVQPDDLTLEVTLTEGESLNGVFTQLSEQGITIASMRNKSNRLEELFMRLVDQNIQNQDSMKESGL
jgi:ABC-2 type transport system ATP-binding protein